MDSEDEEEYMDEIDEEFEERMDVEDQLHHALKRKYFIQYMIEKGSVTIKNALSYLQQHKDFKQLNEEAIKEMILEVDRMISDHSLRLSLAKCEITGNELIVLLNSSKNITERHVFFSPAELQHFNFIFKAIITDPVHKINIIDCFKNSEAKLTKDDMEQLIDKLIKVGYFVQKGDFIHFGIRCILEFTPYLTTNFKDYVTSCYLCKELVLTAVFCRECNIQTHKFCMDKYKKSSNKCPSCRKPLVDEDSED